MYADSRLVQDCRAQYVDVTVGHFIVICLDLIVICLDLPVAHLVEARQLNIGN